MTVEWVSLGSVLERVDRWEAVRADSEYRSAGLLNRGRGLFEKPSVAGSETKYPKLNRLAAGDVVYSKLFGWEGSVAIVPEAFEGAFVSSEFPTFAIDAGSVSRRYLKHYLASPGFMALIGASTTGLGQRRQRVNPSAFVSLPIPLPPRPEQDRIADHLDSLGHIVARAQTELDSARLVTTLPRLIGDLLRCCDRPTVTVGELASNRQIVIHPGDDLQGATAFIGLEHIESHTGRASSGRRIGEEKGRKLLFRPGQVTYGYLRPYLNKAWAAHSVGLCSVEQFVLQPARGVDPRMLSLLLRSDFVWDAAKEATNGLQLPRLSLKKLLAFRVPDVRAIDDVSSVIASGNRVIQVVAEIDARRSARLQIAESILPAARNEIFTAMR